ncbi:MAG: helix-turn-helix transcriptional regulator [Ruminococcaceae bacterium]|nr:helix-turn-helix transcriptional regulator [Oscillospiraceae bacterium]
MLLGDIHPFLRYVRYLVLDADSAYAPAVGYDARLFYTHNGTGVISVAGTDYPMQRGSALFINAGIPYHLKTPDHGVTYLAFNFDYTQYACERKMPIAPDEPARFSPDRITERVSFTDCPDWNVAVFLEHVLDEETALEQMEREFSQRLLYYECSISSRFSLFLLKCARAYHAPHGQSVTHRVIDYVHTHFDEPLTNQTLGAHFGLHPNHISSLIKQMTGMPLHQYVLHVRLTNAISMLEEGKHSIGEIAEKCGFCDVYYFSRYFKQATGTPPNKYRGKQ